MAQSESPVERPSILVVDDDQDIREAVAEVLAGEGYSTRTAGNGQEALAVLSGLERPCLVLLDLMMPVMDGYEVLARLRENPVWRGFPVVVCTASRSTAPEGASGILRKPFEVDELLSLVGGHCPPS